MRALTEVERLQMAAVKLAPWMSAALSDGEESCVEFKQAAEEFLEATATYDMAQTVERIESIVASTDGLAVTSDAMLKTLGNHLCDLLREGECLEIERNFECVSGLSVTAVAANGRESTIGIGPEHMVRRADRDRFAEKVAQVLNEAREAR